MKIVYLTEALKKARREHTNRLIAEMAVKHVLKNKESALIANGEIVGKNAEERSAQLSILTAVERENLFLAEIATRQERVEMECAEDDVECEKLIMGA